MNKKVSLKEIVGTKIVYAIILTSYYWMWARTDWKDWYEMMQYVLGAFLFSFFSLQMIRISKYKKEGIDEMAEQNLKRCDSICLKLFVGVMVAVAFGAAALEVSLYPLPSAGCNLPDAILTMSKIQRMPKHPPVSSFSTPIPV